MKQKEQKQQNYYPLLSNLHHYILRKTKNKSKFSKNESQIQQYKQQSRLKTVLPAITDKRSLLLDQERRVRLKTQQLKQTNSNGIGNLNNSIHQYRSVINTGQKGQDFTNRLINMKERIVEQYKTESFQQKLKHINIKDQQISMGMKLNSDSRKIMFSSDTSKQMASERSYFVQNIKQSKQKFTSSIETLPKTVKGKNEENLSEILKYLRQFNPFFHRNNKTNNLCLLKIGRIMTLKNILVYKRGEQSPYFYLILLGKVKLQNGNLIKYCQTGQSINEEIIFSLNQKKISLQKAKVIGRAHLLQIEVSQWLKLTSRMLMHGFKNQIIQSQALIKRNYITKNWLRNRAKKQNQI